MKSFSGFPPLREMAYIRLPAAFFASLLPAIDDLDELRVTLHFLSLWAHKRGYPRFVARSELMAERPLMAGLSASSGAERAFEHLDRMLLQAVRRGTLLCLDAQKEGRTEIIYFLNSPDDRQALEKLRQGEISWPGVEVIPPSLPDPAQPSIFALYEDNIGLITPLLAEELKQAEGAYPAIWIKEAFAEAARNNRLSWRYVEQILKRWGTEGRQNGKRGRDSKEDGPPDKFIRGKYGHLVHH